MLVLYRLALAPETVFPLTLYIPTSAGQPNAVAVGASDADVADVTWERQVDGAWAKISFMATEPAVRLEYYDPSLTKTGLQRHYEFQWLGDYAVDALTIVIQQPVGASQLQISPGTSQAEEWDDGLTYYTQHLGAVSAGQSLKLTLDYQKIDDALSVEKMLVQPSGELPNSSGGPFDLTQALPSETVVALIVGGLGLLLIVGGLVWYFRTGRQGTGGRTGAVAGRRAGARVLAGGKKSAARRRGRKQDTRRVQDTRKTDAAAVSGGTEDDAEGADYSAEYSDGQEAGRYCHQCGNRAAPGDVFCRACGTELRR
jgi:hypothetical protein